MKNGGIVLSPFFCLIILLKKSLKINIQLLFLYPNIAHVLNTTANTQRARK